MLFVNYPEIKEECGLPVFVRGIGMKCPRETAKRPSVAYPHILYSVEGTGEITVDGVTYEIPPRTGFYLNTGVEYELSQKDEWLVNWVAFDFGLEEMKDKLFLNRRFVFATYKFTDKSQQLFEELYAVLTRDSAYGGTEAAALLFHLLIEFNRQLTEAPETTEKSHRVIQRVVDYINEHYREEIMLATLCEVAGGFSEQYLCRLFRQKMGMRPIEYLLKKRIGVARSCLEKTDLSLNDIALMSGFHNASYFYRNFKKFTGTSPLRYRQIALGIKPKQAE